MSLEATMSRLAISQLNQSTPSLREYLLGFEMIENDEEANRGLGVTVANIGGNYIYIPAIFGRGRIYDMDIMYAPAMDQFMPTQDDWISLLKSRSIDLNVLLRSKAYSRGGARGGASNVFLTMPFNNITKVASDNVPGLLSTAARDFAAVIQSNIPEDIDVPHVMDLVRKHASLKGLFKVSSVLQSTEGVNSFAQFYSDKDIQDIMQAIDDGKITQRERLTKVPLGGVGTVKVLTSGSAEAKELSMEDKVEILRDGAIIKDTRGLIPSLVYKNKQNSDWTVPEHNGLYELLKADGSTVTAYVINLNAARGTTKFNTTKWQYAVIPVDDGQKREAHRCDFPLLGQAYPFQNVPPMGGTPVESLKPSNGDDVKLPTHYMVFVTPAGDSITLRGGTTADCYWVTGEEKSLVNCKFNSDPLNPPDDFDYRMKAFSRSGTPPLSSLNEAITRITVGRPGAKLRLTGDTLRVPEGTRVYPIPLEGSNALNLVDFSNGMDAIALREKAVGVTVYNNNDLLLISDRLGKQASFNKPLDAQKYLVEEFIINPFEAVKMVKEATASGKEEYLVKVAEDNIAIGKMMLGSELPSSESETSTEQLSQMSIGEEDQQIITNAAASGVKEVFDVSILRLLASDTSSVREVQSLLPSLFKAMDSAARILFLCRAGDSIAWAYGEERAHLMEKRLKRLVADLGDIILTLQQGMVAGIEDLMEGPLSSTLG